MDYPSSSYPKGISHSMRKQYYETLTEIYKRSECIMLIDECIGAEKTTEITDGVLACAIERIIEFVSDSDGMRLKILSSQYEIKDGNVRDGDGNNHEFDASVDHFVYLSCRDIAKSIAVGTFVLSDAYDRNVIKAMDRSIRHGLTIFIGAARREAELKKDVVNWCNKGVTK